MKKMVECKATVSSDGRLTLPDEVAREIAGEKQVTVLITFGVDTPISDERDGWEILRSMPLTAGEGRLPTAAEDHDRYLYRR